MDHQSIRKPGVTFGYIAGTSYCGSTLLSFLMNAQPGVVSVGEVAWSIPKQNPGSYQCSCGAKLSECLFWRRVSNEMAQRGFVFDADHWDTAFEIPGNGFVGKLAVRSLRSDFADNLRDSIIARVAALRSHLNDVGRRNSALVDSIATLTGASAFVDASKDSIRIPFLRKYAAIEPRIIHLVRDSPAFVNSYLKKFSDRRAFHKAIAWWNRTAHYLDRLRKRTSSENWLLVRYEDLCRFPEQEIRRILDFLGQGSVAPCLQFRTTSHHIIGNTMRLSDTSEIQLDSSWRSNLSTSQVKQIQHATNDYRRNFGYAT